MSGHILRFILSSTPQTRSEFALACPPSIASFTKSRQLMALLRTMSQSLIGVNKRAQVWRRVESLSKQVTYQWPAP